MRTYKRFCVYQINKKYVWNIIFDEDFVKDEPDREYKFQAAGGFNSKQVEKESYFVLELLKTEVDAPV